MNTTDNMWQGFSIDYRLSCTYEIGMLISVVQLNSTQLNCGFISITKNLPVQCNEEQVTITVDAKWRDW